MIYVCIVNYLQFRLYEAAVSYFYTFDVPQDQAPASSNLKTPRHQLRYPLHPIYYVLCIWIRIGIVIPDF